MLGVAFCVTWTFQVGQGKMPDAVFLGRRVYFCYARLQIQKTEVLVLHKRKKCLYTLDAARRYGLCLVSLFTFMHGSKEKSCVSCDICHAVCVVLLGMEKWMHARFAVQQ